MTINERRWANFKANRRGYVSLWIFLTIFTMTLFAELIANDRPLVLILEGEVYFPALVRYSEAELGGTLPIEANYKGAFMRALIERRDGWVLWPPIPYSHDTIDPWIQGPAPMAPSAAHWLGTDDTAKDTLARLIYGFRLSVLFGFALTLVSSVIGVTVGAIQGFFGGKVDLIGQRFVEIWAGLPILFLLIILASMVEPSVYWLLGLLVLFNWMALVSVVRAEFLRARNFDFVTAARALGVSDRIIMVKHVLPNAMVATLTYLPFIMNGGITLLTALDFLGFGLPPGSPSLGELLAQGKSNLEAPWLGITGFMTLAIMLTLLFFIGEAVRDAFDPRRTFSSSAAGDAHTDALGAPSPA